MAKRSSRSHTTRMSIYAAMGGTNRKEPAGLALPKLKPLEPSPWDEAPFRPEAKGGSPATTAAPPHSAIRTRRRGGAP